VATSDPKRVHEAFLHIRQIKAGSYPQMVGNQHEPESPYRVVERPWAEVAEPSKVRILLGAVDWRGITDKDQAHMVLAEVDPEKITDAQRSRLIDMAEAKPSRSALGGYLEKFAGRIVGGREKESDKGIER
jgi:hypothetical protein